MPGATVCPVCPASPHPKRFAQAHGLDDIPEEMPGLPVEEEAQQAAELDCANARVRQGSNCGWLSLPSKRRAALL